MLEKIIKYLYLKPIKCLIWDYDGTLYQDKEMGIKLKKAFFLISKNKQKNLTIIQFDKKSEELCSWSRATVFYTSMEEEDVLKMAEKKVDKLSFVNKNQKLVDFIESTKQKYRHIILTNSTEKEVLEGLKKIGFKKNTFEKIFSRDVTGMIKPNNKIMEQIQKYTGLTRKQHLCIGDSINCDILPSREYGFKAIPIWELFDYFGN